MSEAEARVGWGEVLRPEWLPSLAVLLGGILVHSMNVLLVATVLPSIVADVGGAALLAWPMTSFMAASIIAATSSGIVASRIGPRGGYMLGAALFAVGSVACALAPSMAEIIAGRFVQGFGGGIIAGLAYVLVRKTFPERVWPRVFAMLAGVWSVSVILGPLIGGVFANLGNWRAAFITVALVAGTLGVVTYFALPKVAADPATRRRFPAVRLSMVVAGIAILSLASVADPAWQKGGLVVLAMTVLAIMIRFDRRADDRILPSDAFTFGSVTGVGIWTALTMSVIFTQMPTFMPLFLQHLHGADPLTAGYMVACASLAWTTVAVSVSGLTGAWPSRLIVLGPVLTCCGLLGMSMLTNGPSLLAVLPAIVVMGMAMGSCWAFLVQRIMSGAREGEGDHAASSIAMVQQGGLGVGAALAGVAANAAGLSQGVTPQTVASAAFWVPVSFMPLALFALFMAIRLWRLTGMRNHGFR
ncbi:MAG: MFS transporter [Minwuia sp.]|uniref:MFS transporter n=1 Tax=Minwuia sp. TaxID=2493630 RepID=UPI003A85A081